MVVGVLSLPDLISSPEQRWSGGDGVMQELLDERPSGMWQSGGLGLSDLTHARQRAGISAHSSLSCLMPTVWMVCSRWPSTATCSCPLTVVSTGCHLPSSGPPAPSLSPTSPSIGRTALSSSSETIDGMGEPQGARRGLGAGDQHRRHLKARWPGPITCTYSGGNT